MHWARTASTPRLCAVSSPRLSARSLGVDVVRLRLLVIVGVALGIGGAVAVTGTIGFIGLVAPHLMRPLIGHDPARLLVPSALAGSALLLAADIAVDRKSTRLNSSHEWISYAVFC